jgi:hypothetical protein
MDLTLTVTSCSCSSSNPFLPELQMICPLLPHPLSPVILTSLSKLMTQNSRRTMPDCRGFTNNHHLQDLYLNGTRYTWSNMQNVAAMVKLDRVLFSMNDGMQLFLTACYIPCPLKCLTTALCSSLAMPTSNQCEDSSLRIHGLGERTS